MAGTTADKLNKLEQTKADFKTTMTDMGLDVTDELPFGEYPPLLLGINSMKKVPLRIHNTYSRAQTPVCYLYVNEENQLVLGWFSDEGVVDVTTIAGAPLLLYNWSRYTVLSGSMQYVGEFTIRYSDRSSSGSIRSYTMSMGVVGEDGVSVKY